MACVSAAALRQFPRPGSSDPSKLLAPKSVLVGVRTARQGCVEMGSAGFGAGSLQGPRTRGKIPHLLSCLSRPLSLFISSKKLCGLCRPQSFFLPHPAPPFHLVFVFPCCLLLVPFEHCKSLARDVFTSGCCVFGTM